MTGRRPLIGANWKMNGTLASIRSLAVGIADGVKRDCTAEVVICAPFPYLGELRSALSGTAIALGAQTVSEHESGAYTGEVSAAMLRDYNCRFVIIGHSERRILFHESDDAVARKVLRAVDAGLTPILSVGEELDEREAGLTQEVVARQFDRVVDVAGMARFGRAVIAYEPVWA
ncbi:MAG: triose-phosphate isomerase, partial [Gammaproteobacteria bacterium]